MNCIDTRAAGDMLRGADNVLILSHQKPDGDTLGSAFALLFALQALGKTARVECSDGYPQRFSFLFGDYRPAAFEPELVVTVDVANAGLLGDLRDRWAERIDLCIDHHKSNTVPAAHTLLDEGAAACALIMAGVIRAMGVSMDARIADCLYTGITTDTGCFRYANVTAQTHRVAAEMIEHGARHSLINKLMFETKSRGRVEIDRVVSDSLEYHHDGRSALVVIPEALTERLGVSEDELDGVSSFPRKIEGVVAGITLRERRGSYRISLRTEGGLDASAICAHFGGGGHKNAAGCTINAPLDEAKRRILQVTGQAIEAMGG